MTHWTRKWLIEFEWLTDSSNSKWLVNRMTHQTNIVKTIPNYSAAVKFIRKIPLLKENFFKNFTTHLKFTRGVHNDEKNQISISDFSELETIRTLKTWHSLYKIRTFQVLEYDSYCMKRENYLFQLRAIFFNRDVSSS